MNDILPPDSARWEWFEQEVRGLMARYGYRNMRTPIVEPTPLFVRGLGEVTDIVEKEMYSFEDRDQRRAAVAAPRVHRRHGARRGGAQPALRRWQAAVWYMGPMFRHERPQRGRYRQFHQIGAEALGFAGARGGRRDDPAADALWARRWA
jgi:histidyl-tRNA synthetase